MQIFTSQSLHLHFHRSLKVPFWHWHRPLHLPHTCITRSSSNCSICKNNVTRSGIFFTVYLYRMNKHREFHNYNLKPIGNNIRVSWTKNGESSKNLTFFDFHDFFYGDILSGFLWNFFSWFTYTIWTNTGSFIPADWKQSEIIFKQVGQKTDNFTKIWLFPIFTIFFTPIHSSDFFLKFCFMVQLYHINEWKKFHKNPPNISA